MSVFSDYTVPPHIGGRAVTTVHAMIWLRFPETMDKKDYIGLQKRMARSIAHSSHILTLSQFSKEKFVSLIGCSGGTHFHCPLCALLIRGNRGLRSMRRKILNHKTLFVVCGTIEPRKNLLCLLKACATLQHEQGIARQAGAGWEADGIYRMAEELPDVILTGYVSA